MEDKKKNTQSSKPHSKKSTYMHREDDEASLDIYVANIPKSLRQL